MTQPAPLIPLSVAVRARLSAGRIQWNATQISQALETLWQLGDEQALVLRWTVRSHRMIGAMRRRFDRQGWSLRTTTLLDTNQVAVMIRARRTGYRVRRIRRP